MAIAERRITRRTVFKIALAWAATPLATACAGISAAETKQPKKDLIEEHNKAAEEIIEKYLNPDFQRMYEIKNSSSPPEIIEVTQKQVGKKYYLSSSAKTSLKNDLDIKITTFYSDKGDVEMRAIDIKDISKVPSMLDLITRTYWGTSVEKEDLEALGNRIFKFPQNIVWTTSIEPVHGTTIITRIGKVVIEGVGKLKFKIAANGQAQLSISPS